MPLTLPLGSRVSALWSLIPHKTPNVRNLSHMAGGLQPASLVVLPQSLAPAFERFCQANSGPLPLLGRSPPGKWTVPAPDTRLSLCMARLCFQGKLTCHRRIVSLGGATVHPVTAGPHPAPCKVRRRGKTLLKSMKIRLVTKDVKDFSGATRSSPTPAMLCVLWPVLMAEQAPRNGHPQFWKYELGARTGSVTSLEENSESLKDMVALVLSCSCTPEVALEKAGLPCRTPARGSLAGAYKTTVPCSPIAGFGCPLVVTMRPVPQDQLGRLVQASCSLGREQGQPVHIGDPALLGIKDLSRPDYGDAVACQPGDVPVFWTSQLTCLEALSSCKTPLAFTSAPGSTVMTDLKDTEAPASSEGVPEVHLISQDPLHYSIASASAVQKIQELETIIAVDPGNRGIGHLFRKGELLRAALSLSHSRSVLVTTGFPTHFKHEPPEENDGPPGAFALAAFLQALGKDVSLVVDQRALALFEKLVGEAVKEGVLETHVPLLTFQGGSTDAARSFLCKDGNPTSPRFDHLVAIERSGRAADGNYYNARKVNIRHLVDPIDDLFLAARAIPGISSTGVGDGGNELGMGKVKEAVKRHIRNGDVIACDVAADFAVIAGVSNWGGYALAYALHILNSCAIHRRYWRKAVGAPRDPREHIWTKALPSVTKEEKMLEILARHQVRSGVTGAVGMVVDGLPFHDTHAQMIQQLVDVTVGRG